MDAVETACARNAIGWAMDVTSEGATATLTCCSTDDRNLVFTVGPGEDGSFHDEVAFAGGILGGISSAKRVGVSFVPSGEVAYVRPSRRERRERDCHFLGGPGRHLCLYRQ